VSGGTSPYGYSWSNGSTSEDISSLAPNTYNVTVTDANGCTATTSVVITQPAVLNASISGTNVSCNGGSTGSADLSVTGGTAPFSYSWSNLATSQDLSNIAIGSYDVTVTDAHGCTATSSVTISQPSAVAVTSSNDGPKHAPSSVTLSSNGSGGTGTITYSWSPSTGMNSATAQNPVLGSTIGSYSGIYTVTATDANGCSATSTTSVTVYGTKLYVNNNSTTNDVFTSAVGNNANYGTPASPFATLQFALSVSRSNDTIYMDAGDYTFNGNLDSNGMVIYGPYMSLDNAKGSRTSAAEATISAAAGTSPVFTIGSSVSSYTLNGLKLVGTTYNDASSGHVIHASGQSTTHNVLNNIIQLSSEDVTTQKSLVWFGGAVSNNGSNYIQGNVNYNTFRPLGNGTNWRGITVNQKSQSFNITGNVFENHTIGRCITLNHPSSTTVISYNEFNLSQTTLEMVMIQGAGASSPSTSGVVIQNNLFTSVGSSSSVGLTINNINYGTNALVTNNAFNTIGKALKTGNATSAVTVTATCNWWNQSTGALTPTSRVTAGTNVTISTGTYATVGTDANGSATGFENSNCSGSKEAQEPTITTASTTINIYPNPTQDQLHVDFNATEHMTVELKLVDMSGRIVKTIQTDVEEGINYLSLDMNELANGIYSLVVLNNNQLIHTVRVVKN